MCRTRCSSSTASSTRTADPWRLAGSTGRRLPWRIRCRTGRASRRPADRGRAPVRILVVEDERRLASLIARGLTEAGHGVEVRHTGPAGLHAATAMEFDGIVLDLMLPDLDGLAVCRVLRERGRTVPVLMLTARAGVADRIAGLDSGADDYLPKPFAFDELLARLRALHRRATRPTESTVLAAGDLRVDPGPRRVWRGDREI